MSAPLIAIPAYHLADDRVPRWPHGGYGVPGPYVDALHRARAQPAIIPEGDRGDPGEILARFDGLLLVGGGDVEPSAYGAQPGSTLYGLEPDRDRLEIDLLLAADERGMPALAICRGAQVMNVAFGGTLHQHLPDVDGLIEHGIPLAGTATRHSVTLAAESRAQAASGASTLVCSSHHHQGIAELGEGLVATGWSEDGLVEAIEREGGWILGVQWHPEDMASDNPAQQAFFSELVARAANRSG